MGSASKMNNLVWKTFQACLATVLMISVLENLSAQSVEYDEKAKVGGANAEIDEQDKEVTYTSSKKLEVWAYAVISPHGTANIPVRIKYRFNGTLSDGTEYDSGWATNTKNNFPPTSDDWEVAAYRLTNSSKGEWTYQCKVEKFVNNEWVAVGSTSITFVDTNDEGGMGGGIID
jgi:hypothetical protein